MNRYTTSVSLYYPVEWCAAGPSFPRSRPDPLLETACQPLIDGYPAPFMRGAISLIIALFLSVQMSLNAAEWTLVKHGGRDYVTFDNVGVGRLMAQT